MIFELFQTLGAKLYAQYPKTIKPGAVGYGLHGRYVLKCAGTMQPNPGFDSSQPDSDANPAQILVQHAIGTFAGDENTVYRIGNVPQLDAQGKVIGDSDLGCITDASFAFVDAEGNPTGQDAIDPSNPVCLKCGAPVQIGV